MKQVEGLKAAELLLKDIKIPGKKDSMLNAAKHNHIDEVGNLLLDLLSKDKILASEVIANIVEDFKKEYNKKFLKILD